MLHSLDPFAVRFTETFGLRWYGLSYMAGFLFAYAFIYWMAKTKRSHLKPGQAGDFVTYGAVGILAGGRLGYCLFYSPELFFEFSAGFPFWGALALNKGGMASHGGLIGLVLACLLYARKHDLLPSHLVDLVCFCGPVGIFFGRLANFVNGELVGREAPRSYAFGVKFPQDIQVWPEYAPDRLNELVPVVRELGVSEQQWRSWLSGVSTDLQSRLSVNKTLEQIVLAVQSGNEAVQSALEPLLTYRYPSQIYAALFEGLFVFLVLAFVWRKPQRPGVITATCLITYALARIWTEQYRLPDLHIGYELLGLTRGQWLSVALLIAGAGLLIWCRKRGPGITLGGLSSPSNKR